MHMWEKPREGSEHVYKAGFTQEKKGGEKTELSVGNFGQANQGEKGRSRGQYRGKQKGGANRFQTKTKEKRLALRSMQEGEWKRQAKWGGGRGRKRKE